MQLLPDHNFFRTSSIKAAGDWPVYDNMPTSDRSAANSTILGKAPSGSNLSARDSYWAFKGGGIFLRCGKPASTITRRSRANCRKLLSVKIFFSSRMQGRHQSLPEKITRTFYRTAWLPEKLFPGQTRPVPGRCQEPLEAVRPKDRH